MIRLFIIYIIITIIEIIYYNYYSKNWKQYSEFSKLDEIIKFNLDNEKELNDAIHNFINERLEMAKKMNYDDWIKYNNENYTLTFKEKEYYLFVYDSTSSLNDRFILRASYLKSFIDLDYEVERRTLMNEHLFLELYQPTENLPKLMYETLLGNDHFSSMSYYWINSFLHVPTLKKTQFTTFHLKNGENIINGVIGMGFDINNVNVNYGNIFLNSINVNYLFFLNIFIFLISLAMYYIYNQKQIVKPVLFLIITNIYIFNHLSLYGINTNLQIEETTLNSVVSSTLGLSFLVASNIFIINNIKNKEKNFILMKKSITFLFVVSLVFLLFSMYKSNNFKDLSTLRTMRIESQLFFNISILFNLFIFFSYFTYLLNSFIHKSGKNTLFSNFLNTITKH